MTERFGEKVNNVDPKLLTLDEVEMSLRVYEALKKVGIGTLGDIVSHDILFYKDIPGLNQKAIEEIEIILNEKNLKLKDVENSNE